MTLLYVLHNVPTRMLGGNYYVKMYVCGYSTMNVRSYQMYHTCIDLSLTIK